MSQIITVPGTHTIFTKTAFFNHFNLILINLVILNRNVYKNLSLFTTLVESASIVTYLAIIVGWQNFLK